MPSTPPTPSTSPMPTTMPTPSPSPMPTVQPTPSPSPSPTTVHPTPMPTTPPTPSPSPMPTVPPTPSPTPSPVPPTNMPSPSPSPMPTVMPSPSPTPYPTPWCPCITLNSTTVSGFEGTYITTFVSKNEHHNWKQRAPQEYKEIYYAYKDLFDGYWVIVGTNMKLAAYDEDGGEHQGMPPLGTHMWNIFEPGTTTGSIL